MIYPQNASEKLGFADIKTYIKAHCLSDMGRQMVDKVQPMANFDNIQKFMSQTKEFKDILENDSPLPINHLYDIKSLADKIKIEGAFLMEFEFHQVLLSLQTVFSVINYFNEREGRYLTLEALFEHLPIEKSILRNIDSKIDERGKLRPNASTELQQITSAISRAEQDARKRIDHIFKNAQGNNWTADGSLTVRDGRLCIPLLAENKRKLKGFVHDESASGQTVFLEPEEVFHLNNQLRDLEFEKRREIIKILTALSTALRPYVPLLMAYHGLLTKLDFVRAKALFAIDIEGQMPVLTAKPELSLFNARHPLLYLTLKKEGQSVIPLNVRIDDGQRIVVVSGPNAGGKSVCMKTVGLLQIMAQAGLLIPVDDHSTVGVFKQIFADIGDDQSIESDLSTYSAHLSKMKYFVENSGGKSLILIDEFGTGTDPQFGGPIAEAVLEALNRKQVRGVITTHYSNLKVFANATDGLENASMMFDNIHMIPLYILEMGKPGSSYAFEIAQKIGLPAQVINAAKGKIGVQQKRVDSLLVDLEREKKGLWENKVSMDKQQRKLDSLMKENEELRVFLDENRKTIIKDARQEARNIISGANKLVENTISEIKKVKADKDKTLELRKKLHVEADKHVEKEKKTALQPDQAELAVGDWVKLTDSETLGQVIDVSKDNVILAIGDLRSVVKRKRVEKVSKKQVPKDIRRAGSSSVMEEIAQFRPEIDIRGYRGEDALYEIEKYLDKALMMGFSNLKIIHGKGDGILRKLIRDYLRKYPQVVRMEDEHADRGGDGITYVYLS